MKPTYGVVSRFGLVAFASSLDQIGPFANTAEDLRILMSAIAGADKLDSTSLKLPDDFSAIKKPKVVGVPEEFFGEGLDSEIKTQMESLQQQLSSNGYELRPIHLPHTQYAVAVYYIIATAECSSNLARYDGVRYGLRKEGDGLIDMYMKTRQAGFGEEVKRRVLLGTYVLSSGYYDAYYLKAQKVRALIRNDFEEAFKTCDVILTPTAPTPAFTIGEKSSDPLQMYLSDIYTISVNLAGLPALSFPVGKTSGGIPFGGQLIGPALSDFSIIDMVRAIEKWHEIPRLEEVVV